MPKKKRKNGKTYLNLKRHFSFIGYNASARIHQTNVQPVFCLLLAHGKE